MSRITVTGFTLVLFFVQNLGASPDDLLSKKYREQRITLDSLVLASEHNHEQVISELSNIENVAREKGNASLETLALLTHYRYLLTNEAFGSQQEIKTLELSQGEESYLKADALQLLADYYWTQKKFTTSL